MNKKVLLTDHAWPDDSIERQVIESAGFTLVTGPAEPAEAKVIEALVQEHQPSAILTCWAPVTSTAIESVTGLQIVARLGVGLDNIAVQTATENGTWVSNVPDYCVEEVSDHALGFALAWTRGISFFGREVRDGRWEPAAAKLRRLSALTCGVLGLGRIGIATARKFKAMGCQVLAHSAVVPEDTAGARIVSLDTLLGESDIIVLHLPLNESTHHLINRSTLARMKPGALLINLSRGAIVDTDALIEALESDRLAAVGLDVLETEPLVPGRLRNHPQSMITPHVGFSSDASLQELRRRAAQEVVRVLQGETPSHPCNTPQIESRHP